MRVVLFLVVIKDLFIFFVVIIKDKIKNGIIENYVY